MHPVKPGNTRHVKENTSNCRADTLFAVTNFTQNDRNFGPAIQMHVNTPDGKHGSPFVVWQNFPDFDVKRAGTYSFALLGLDQQTIHRSAGCKRPGGQYRLGRMFPDGFRFAHGVLLLP